MSDGTCIAPGCGATRLNAKGMCGKHYMRWSRNGSFELQGRTPGSPPKSCAVDGCDRQRRNLKTGWCRVHHDRWVRTGSTGKALIESRRRYKPGDSCAVDDCPAAPQNLGWCGKHYARFWKYGDPLKLTMRERPSHRSCGKCLRTPSEVDFKEDKRSPDGLGAYCKPCAKEYSAAYYSANQAITRAKNSARYYANRDRYLAAQRAYRLANLDLVRSRERLRSARHTERRRERSRRWRTENREQFLASMRSWYQRNKEYHRQYSRRWSAANRDKVREYSANSRAKRSAQKRNAEGKIEWINRREIWKRDRGICGLCALPVPFRDMHLDHKVALANGGPHTKANVHTTHSRCNLSKGSREVPQWGFARIAVPAPRKPLPEGALTLF